MSRHRMRSDDQEACAGPDQRTQDIEEILVHVRRSPPVSVQSQRATGAALRG
jgi:hypothetical protein